MKKHADALAKVTTENINTTVDALRIEISDLTRGTRLGDVQNYKMIAVKKKELARLLTRKQKEAKETK